MLSGDGPKDGRKKRGGEGGITRGVRPAGSRKKKRSSAKGVCAWLVKGTVEARQPSMGTDGRGGRLEGVPARERENKDQVTG